MLSKLNTFQLVFGSSVDKCTIHFSGEGFNAVFKALQIFSAFGYSKNWEASHYNIFYLCPFVLSETLGLGFYQKSLEARWLFQYSVTWPFMYATSYVATTFGLTQLEGFCNFAVTNVTWKRYFNCPQYLKDDLLSLTFKVHNISAFLTFLW